MVEINALDVLSQFGFLPFATDTSSKAISFIPTVASKFYGFESTAVTNAAATTADGASTLASPFYD